MRHGGGHWIWPAANPSLISSLSWPSQAPLCFLSAMKQQDSCEMGFKASTQSLLPHASKWGSREDLLSQQVTLSLILSVSVLLSLLLLWREKHQKYPQRSSQTAEERFYCHVASGTSLEIYPLHTEVLIKSCSLTPTPVVGYFWQKKSLPFHIFQGVQWASTTARVFSV